MKQEKNKFKTERTTLKAYSKHKEKINELLKELNDPLIIKGISYDKLGASGYKEVKADIERVSELRLRIINDINRSEEFIYRVNSALNMIKDDKYYKVIEMKTILGKTTEEVAELFNVSTTTINENENRLLGELKREFKIQNFTYF